MSTPHCAPTYEPNPLLAYLYHRFFEHIRVDETWIRTVREAASKGSVVYVLRNLSFLDFLALDHLTKRYELPRIRFANDLGLWVLEPMGKGWLRALAPQDRTAAAHELISVIEDGGSAALFLKRAPTVMSRASGKAGPRQSMTEGDDLVRALFALQRRRTEPILLVPQVFVWSKLPDERRPGVVAALLGSREWPGKIRTTLQFLRNYGHVAFRAGEPVDLREYLLSAEREEGGPSDDGALIRRLTYSMLRKLERERRCIVGPVKKPLDRIRQEVVRSPKLQTIIRDLAGDGESERLVLTQRAYTILRELEAQQDPALVARLEPAFDYIINRIYDGIEVDQEGLERVRQAARRGNIVLLPSHRSHLDYVVLHYLFHKNDLQLPLVASGDNLSFFPLGILFRRAGAFFIRRSFANDRLYAAVVDAYIRRLIREGHAIEFYIEGGRSRSGKLLSPKLGLLSMVVDAALNVPHREVFFVPVSVGYDRLVEGTSYVHENLGGEKQKETARGLLQAARLLRGRYGRVTVQFGNIIPFDTLLTQAAGTSVATRVNSFPSTVPALTPTRIESPAGPPAAGLLAASPPASWNTAALRPPSPPTTAASLAPPESAAPPSSDRFTNGTSWQEQAVKRLSPAKRRGLITRLAHQVMAEINRVTAVTPGAVVALVMLSDRRRGVPYGDLIRTSTQVVHLLEHLGAPISQSLHGPGSAVREGAIDDAAHLFLDAEVMIAAFAGDADASSRRRKGALTGPEIVYRVPDDKRLTLDISKNSIVHFLVPRAFLAAAFLSTPGAATSEGQAGGAAVDAAPPARRIDADLRVPRALLEERVRTLAQLFKHEFTFRSDMTFEEHFGMTLAHMTDDAELAITDKDEITVGARREHLGAMPRLAFYASVMQTFLEGYRVAARGLGALLKGPLSQKDLVRKSITVGERMFLDREIERREAVGRMLFENAHSSFADQGYITIQQRKVAIAESFATAAAVGTIEARLAGFLADAAQGEPAV